METTYNIIKENGSFILIACISILFIACHVLYKFNFLFSPSISEMPETKKPLKIVVFDLDETLGCFVEIGIFWGNTSFGPTKSTDMLRLRIHEQLVDSSVLNRCEST